MGTKVKLPITADIEMKRGADWWWTLKLREDDGVTPKDTTGYTMTMTIKESRNGETYDTLTIGDGITHTPSSGQFNLKIPYSDINNYEFANAIYDLIVVDTSTNHICFFYGNVKVMP